MRRHAPARNDATKKEFNEIDRKNFWWKGNFNYLCMDERDPKKNPDLDLHFELQPRARLNFGGAVIREINLLSELWNLSRRTHSDLFL